MLKKLVTTAVAGAFAAVLAAPVAMACPGHEGTVAKKEEKSDAPKTAEKAKDKKSPAKQDKEKSKEEPAKDVSKG